MKKQTKVIYYQDEQLDDFAGFEKKDITIDGEYKYINNNFAYKALAFLAYRCIMTPFCYLYGKIKFGFKIKNKEVLKPYKNSGYFLYANHTLPFADAFIPSFISMPKKPYVIVNKQNLAHAKTFVKMNGALPLPDTMQATKNFLKAIKIRHDEKSPIVIYPEAKIWPYYTKIRNFNEKSFAYPVDYDAPVFCFTTTFTHRKFRKIPKVTVWVDGPFFADKTKTKSEQKQQLRDMAFTTMNERSKFSNYEYVKYIKKENTND